jgi:guanylate kinase
MSGGVEPVARRRGTLVVVSAPSGAGKTTLCTEVRSLIPALAYSVSYTTRAPRPGEVEGEDFHFVSAPAFKGMVEGNEFPSGRSCTIITTGRQPGRWRRR